MQENTIKDFWKKVSNSFGNNSEVDYSRFGDTLLKMWEYRVRKSGDKICVDTLGDKKSFSEIDSLSDNLAIYLIELADKNKIKKEAAVAILIPNISQYLVSMLGIMKAGMIVNNLNPLLTESEIKKQISDCGAEVIISLSILANKAAASVLGSKVKYSIVTDLFDLESLAKRNIKNFIAKKVKKVVPEYIFPENIENLRFIDAIKNKSSEKYNKLKQIKSNIGPEKIAFYQYTGGTTGYSRAAILTQKNMVSSVIASYQCGFKSLYIKEEETRDIRFRSHGWAAHVLPFSHIYGLHCYFLFSVAVGLSGLLIPNPKDSKGLIKKIKSRKIDTMAGIQPLLASFLNYSKFNSLGFKDTLITSGGMGLSKEISNDWEEKTGKLIYEGYGLTECAPIVCFSPWQNARTGYVGVPVSGTIVKLVDDEGKILPLGDGKSIGELLVKGPQVIKNYLGAEEPAVDDSGWLKTGDLATISKDGMVSIVGRKKEMMLVNGFKSYPTEVESIIDKMNKFKEYAVTSVSDLRSGEKIILFLVKKEGDIFDEAKVKKEITDILEKELAPYKVPKEIMFIDEIPKSFVGKTLRYKLKELYLKIN